MNSDEVNWLLQTIEDPENANYDTAKDSSCHDALTGTDVIEFAAAAKHGDSVAFGILRAQSANMVFNISINAEPNGGDSFCSPQSSVPK
jgi:hypothetical protein